jgi:predicted HicB family RNase H-like nuclease
MSKTISARIDDTLHSMITDEANQKGKTVNESLKEMLNNHFNGEQKEEGNLSQIAENSEMVLQLTKTIEENKKNQENHIAGINKILEKIVDSIAPIQRSTLQIVDQRLEDHERKYKHEKQFHSGLKCNL